MDTTTGLICNRFLDLFMNFLGGADPATGRIDTQHDRFDRIVITKSLQLLDDLSERSMTP